MCKPNYAGFSMAFWLYEYYLAFLKIRFSWFKFSWLEVGTYCLSIHLQWTSSGTKNYLQLSPKLKEKLILLMFISVLQGDEYSWEISSNDQDYSWFIHINVGPACSSYGLLQNLGWTVWICNCCFKSPSWVIELMQ